VRLLRLFALLLLPGLLLAGCPADDDDDSTPEPEPCQRPEDRTNPELLAQGPEEAQVAGFQVEILAQASDPEGINNVTLWYRPIGTDTFLSDFTELVDEDNGIYQGVVPGNYVVEPGVEYYVTARDAGPCADETTFPESPAPYLTFETEVAVSGIPHYQDFELEECTTGADLPNGWTAFSQAFPEDTHNWRSDPRTPRSGSCSVSHSEGVPGIWDCPPPEGDGNIKRLNWLISPALDFTGKTEIGLRWYERHVSAGSCAEAHRVYVSTGSPAPGATESDGLGDYVLLAEDLALPGSDWQSSPWFDLSAYAGEETVYVAIVYEGGPAGRWQLDDIYVGEPLADLELDSVTPLDPTVGPGSTGVTLDITVRNVSAEYDAPELSALLTTEDAGLTISAATAHYPAIAVGQTGVNDVAFAFDIDAGHADNAYLDFTLSLDDGAGHLWDVPVRLLMGVESTVEIFATPGDAPLVLTLGHGPVALPNFTESTTTDVIGATGWTLNVTEQAAILPPGPGPMRWFLQAENPGTVDGTVDLWEFTVDAETTGPEEGMPRLVPAGETIVIPFPDPPLLVVDSLTTTPDPAAPAGSVTIDSLVLRNDGAGTVAGVNCVLDSTHPNATGFAGTVLTFGGAPIAADGFAAMDQSTSFDIDAAHVDDEPLPLVLLCSDGFDSIPVQFEMAVPYARPRVDAVLIDDSLSACSGCNGDNDGYADPGETVGVFLTAINDGSLPTSGPLTAAVTASPNSPVPVTITAGNLSFGSDTLDPGSTAISDQPFELAVDANALLGDRMVVDITWQSGSDSWTDEYTIDVTGIPWLPCNAPDDPQGDEIAGTGLDIKSCDYRSDGTMLQVRVNAWEEFDPTVQSLWFFFYEAPQLYTVEFVPPAPPVLETDCIGGTDVTTALPLSVDNQLNTSASVRIGLDDLNELGNSLQVAFAAGYCLGFCDSWPDTAVQWQPANGVLSCSNNQFIQINW